MGRRKATIQTKSGHLDLDVFYKHPANEMHSDDVFVFLHCDYCCGQGEVPCPMCGGGGCDECFEVDTEYDPVDDKYITSFSSKGFVVCSHCDGEGVLHCQKCKMLAPLDPEEYCWSCIANWED